MHSKKHNLTFYSTKNKKVLKSSMTFGHVSEMYNIKSNLSYDTSLLYHIMSEKKKKKKL